MAATPLARVGALGAALLLAVPLLSACGAEERSRISGGSWQISNIHLDPDTPSGIPESVMGRASLVFGETSVVGDTGCASFQGVVNFTRDGEASRADEADAVQFEEVRFDDPDPTTCTGQAVYVDMQLRELLKENFLLSEPEEFQLVLTRDSDEFDPPAIVLSAKSIPVEENE